MKMSHDEIQSDYRDAKDKRKIIGILADQNCCSKKEMREYLREECGFDIYEPKVPSKEQLAAARASKKKKEESKVVIEVKELPPIEEDLPFVDVPQDNVRLYDDNDGGLWSPDAEVDPDTGKVIPTPVLPKCITEKDIKCEAFNKMAEMYGKISEDWMTGFLQGIDVVLGMIGG